MKVLESQPLKNSDNALFCGNSKMTTIMNESYDIYFGFVNCFCILVVFA